MNEEIEICECMNPKLSEKWGWEICKRCNKYTGKKFKPQNPLTMI